MNKTLEFTLTISKCMGCAYCPQSKLGAAYQSEKRVISPFDFDTILTKLPKDVRIDFSGYSEPFLHRDAAQMMLLASDLGYQVHLYSTLMGLNQRQAEHLRRAKIDYVRLHVPDTVGLKVPSDRWLRQFDLFRETGHAFTSMAMGPLDPYLATVLRDLGVEVEMPGMLSRGGNLWQPTNLTERPMRCSMSRWHSNVVLPNGDVYGCCMDYGLTVHLGNLLTQSYEDIYQAGEDWRRNIEPCAAGICASCEWAVAA